MGYQGEDVRGIEKWVDEWFEREEEVERGINVVLKERLKEEEEVKYQI